MSIALMLQPRNAFEAIRAFKSLFAKRTLVCHVENNGEGHGIREVRALVICGK